jgi:SEC-C motif-containing protein
VTAEELMRSRYSAFVLGDAAYLLRTWHPATRPDAIDLDDRIRWTGLEILAADAGGPDDTRGTVEFRATYDAAGVPGVLHEVSRFLRPAGSWLYVRGRILE